jgi:hypothetical protein
MRIASCGRLGFAAVLACASGLSCDGDAGVPPGKVARVGDVVFGPEDVAAVGAQLGAYGQLRFAGEGNAALVAALVDAEVLAQEAKRLQLADDPRVAYALLEEVAAVHRSAELERRLPYAQVAADRPRLVAWYEAHRDAFVQPEQRAAEGVVFRDWVAATRAMTALELGTTTLEELGEVVRTPLQRRDDHEYPGFHPVLFDASLAAGDRLPRPVVVGEGLLVGRVHRIVAAAAPDLDDPATHEKVVQAVREEQLAAIRAAWAEELAAAHPELPPGAK